MIFFVLVVINKYIYIFIYQNSVLKIQKKKLKIQAFFTQIQSKKTIKQFVFILRDVIYFCIF